MTVAPPQPQGDYVAVVRHGDLLVTAGVTPREAGVMRHAGRYGSDDAPDLHRAGVELAARNLLAALESDLAQGEHIAALLSLTVYIAADPGFEDHARVADFATSLLRDRLGDAGRCARAAIGVSCLPGGACVELSAHAVVGRARVKQSGVSL